MLELWLQSTFSLIRLHILPYTNFSVHLKIMASSENQELGRQTEKTWERLKKWIQLRNFLQFLESSKDVLYVKGQLLLLARVHVKTRPFSTEWRPQCGGGQPSMGITGMSRKRMGERWENWKLSKNVKRGWAGESAGSLGNKIQHEELLLLLVNKVFQI